MNVNNLVGTDQTNSTIIPSLPLEYHNVFQIPVQLTIFQKDIYQLLIRFHSASLKSQFGIGQLEPVPKLEHMPDHLLSNNDLISLLYSNLSNSSNNPYLMVDHYIPKNMLVMNTKESLVNVSGKLSYLNDMISAFEGKNVNNPHHEKYNVLVLVSGPKELDFLESLVLGRFVNYRRYSGTKLYQLKKESVHSYSGANGNSAAGNGNGIANGGSTTTKRATNGKEDPYLTRRLRKKHKRIMKYISDTAYNEDYCLTLHLITESQLKFQFFQSEAGNYDLQLSNAIKFDFIVSLNSYVNLDHYYLDQLRRGYYSKQGYVSFPEPTPVLKFVGIGSVEHSGLLIQNWLKKVGYREDREFITGVDEAINTFHLSHFLTELILKVYLLTIHQDSQKVLPAGRLIDSWLLENTAAFEKHGVLPDLKITDEMFLEGFLNGSKEEILQEEDSRILVEELGSQGAIDTLSLKLYEFDYKKNIETAAQLIKNNDEIFAKYSKILEPYKEAAGYPAMLSILLKQEQIDGTDQIIDFTSKHLDELKTLYDKETLNQSEFIVPPEEEPNTLEAYKKLVTKFVKLRFENLGKLILIFQDKLRDENLVGNYLQLCLEKNNSISKDLFIKQTELKKQFVKEEKYMERIFSEYKKFKTVEQDTLVKMNFFEKFRQSGKIHKAEDFYQQPPALELVDELQRKVLLELKDRSNTSKYKDADHEITEQLLEQQKQDIFELERSMRDLDSEAEKLTNTIENSRGLYRENSSKITAQLEEIKVLDEKISSSKSIVDIKDEILGLKKAALTDELSKASNYSALKYQNLRGQKYFLENYLSILKNSFSEKRGQKSSSVKRKHPTDKSNSNGSKRQATSRSVTPYQYM